ncbi:MAG TPA: tetratricopeptide repeat protein [Fibrobacteria bacterium]|nr:tetratricopeptide repeat protein [Fibrobacteria bacterium]
MAARISIWSKLALAVASPLIAFSLCEGILYLAGVKPLSLTEDPYVGFASTQPLFVESRTESGELRMVTNPAKLTHFNFQSFPAQKPPGTFRIFSVGGSTAYGHPWRDPVSFSGWLRELLPKADPGRKWEVINAGGISYASYREAMLIAELIRYQPDLFLVYSGHNEFLEERTYRSTAGIPVAVRELSAFLDQTRTYSALRRLLRPRSGSGGEAETPAAGAGAKTAFNMAGEVDDVLARTIGPTSYTRDDSLHRHVLDHYGVSLARMAKLAHSAGAEVIFLTTPGNEKDCSPFKSEPSPGLSTGDAAKIAAWKAQVDSLADHPAAALVRYDSIVALDPRNAELLYGAGKAAYAAGDFPRAKTLFRRALDEDICPLRALTPMRSIVLETARANSAQALDWTGVLEAKSSREAGNDVLGEPDFVDHVHLSIEDYRLMALAIIGKMSALGMAKTGPGWDETAQGNPAVTEVADRVMAGMGPKELGEGLHNLAKVVNWAGKHEDAARIAERALATDSQGLEAIWSSLFVGAAREREGREAEAIPHYRRAVRLDPGNPMSHRYLAEALLRKGDNEEAAGEFAAVVDQDPGDADAQAKLGLLLASLDRPSEALSHLRGALVRFPNRADLRSALGEALLRSGNAGEAESGFRQALERNPRDARAILGLARIAEGKGNVPEAINLYARALSIDPNLPEARAALSKALGGMPASP